jgi:photosystem II stability/assembly factor-like uncharacterized protein
MKLKIICLLILAFGFLLQQLSGQPAWYIQESPVEEDLLSVSFADSSFGWAATSNGKIIHTTNGGQKWELISNIDGFYPEKIFFQNRDIGWMVGSYTTYLDTSYVMQTNDGGISWRPNYKRIDSKLNDIFFVNDSVGYAVGFEGDTLCLRLKTATSGQYWLDLWGPKIISEFYSVHFRDTTNGVMCGSGPTLQLTKTGGITPPGMVQSIFNFEKEMFDLVNVGSEYGCMVGADGKLWFTKDDWNNYIDYDFPDGDTLRAVDGLPPLSFYVVGDGGTILSIGYNQFLGLTAQDNSFDFYDDLLDIDAVDDAHIWAVGENGTIVSFGYGPGTGNSIFENQEFPSVYVFPNPAKDRVTLSTETGSIKEVVFINLQGHAMLRKKFGSGTDATINVSGLKHGLYLIRIKTQQDFVFSKIVIE